MITLGYKKAQARKWWAVRRIEWTRGGASGGGDAGRRHSSGRILAGESNVSVVNDGPSIRNGVQSYSFDRRHRVCDGGRTGSSGVAFLANGAVLELLSYCFRFQESGYARVAAV